MANLSDESSDSDFSANDDGDFSASEDEWKPNDENISSEDSGEDFIEPKNTNSSFSGFLKKFKENTNKKLYHEKEVNYNIRESPPKFDCMAGLSLSNNNEESLENICETNNKSDNEEDIRKMLEIGENKYKPENRKESNSESDSDWEEVKNVDQSHHKINDYSNIRDIEVVLNLEQLNKKKQKTSDQIEASLKRQINRVIKENQIYLHKVSLLCHIYKGMYCNKTLNSPVLMSSALKLLPNKTCYPNGRTEIKYFISFVKWFKETISLKYDGMYCKFLKRPKLNTSLQLQMKYKSAICKRDYVFIFIILLRAMGIQCRLVINLVTIPIKPPPDDLCSLKQNKTQKSEIKKETKNNTKEGNTQKDKKNKSVKKQKKDVSSSEEYSSNEYDSDNSLLGLRKENKSKNKQSSSTKMDKKSSSHVDHKYSTKSKTSKTNISLASQSKRPKIEKIKHSQELSQSNKNNNDTEKLDKKSKIKLVNLKIQPKSSQSNSIKTVVSENDEKSAEKSSKENERNQKISTNKNSNNDKVTKRNTTSKTNPEKNLNTKSNQRITRSKNEALPKNEKESKTSSNTKSVSRRSKSKSPFDKQLIKINVDSLLKIETKHKNTTTAKKTRGKSSNENIKTEAKKTKSVSTSEKNIKLKTSKSKDSKESKTADSEIKISQLDGVSDNEDHKYVSKKTSTNKKEKVNFKKLAPQKRKSETHSSEDNENFTTSQKKKCLNSKVSELSQIPSTTQNISKNNKVKLKKLVPQKRKSSIHSSSDSDDDFVLPKNKSLKSKLLDSVKRIDRRVLSTDESEIEKDKKKNYNKKYMDYWIEVFSEFEGIWITIDLFKNKVHCVESIKKSVTPPLTYVFAWNNNNNLKDVSLRYCRQFYTTTRKLRVDSDWLEETIEPYLGKKTARDKAEDTELMRMQYEEPLPKTINEFKNHPLYVLKRHLLKFEVIYPPEPVTLGFVRGEPVYARECVHVCHSREIWLKSARVVKPGEQPYKIVKSRPKWDKMTQSIVKNQPLEIFGYWQTMQYDPPTAENGIVPRNEYGNVELFKKCMLPKKTVHLKLTGLNRICRKLGIDCAPAVIGFDFHQGSCHPVFDGFVICEEFADQVIDAWNKDKEETEKKEKEKYLARVYGNWRKLIKGVMIRRKLQLKYNFNT